MAQREFLINLRGSRNQESIALDLGISQQYLSELERGIKNPSIGLMKKFEQLYNCSMTEMFADIFLGSLTTYSGSDNKETA